MSAGEDQVSDVRRLCVCFNSLTVHNSYHTVLPALSVDIVVAQLTSGPADITALSSDLTRDVTRVEAEGDVAERVFENGDQLNCRRLGIGVSLLHSEVDL